MDQVVTIERVQSAIKQLQDLGERVSRRNVRAITGGGMSTVHRLMTLAEEEELYRKRLVSKEISEAFLNAFKNEISLHTKLLVENYEQQIKAIKTQEQEILDALKEAEGNLEKLDEELSLLKATANRDQQKVEKDLAVAKESILRLEAWHTDLKAERKESRKTLEDLRTDNIKKTQRIETLELTIAALQRKA